MHGRTYVRIVPSGIVLCENIFVSMSLLLFIPWLDSYFVNSVNVLLFYLSRTSYLWSKIEIEAYLIRSIAGPFYCAAIILSLVSFYCMYVNHQWRNDYYFYSVCILLINGIFFFISLFLLFFYRFLWIINRKDKLFSMRRECSSERIIRITLVTSERSFKATFISN